MKLPKMLTSVFSLFATRTRGSDALREAAEPMLAHARGLLGQLQKQSDNLRGDIRNPADQMVVEALDQYVARGKVTIGAWETAVSLL